MARPREATAKRIVQPIRFNESEWDKVEFLKKKLNLNFSELVRFALQKVEKANPQPVRKR